MACPQVPLWIKTHKDTIEKILIITFWICSLVRILKMYND